MATTKVKDVIAFLESIAPRSLQESYDNSGLLVGDPASEVKGILVSLDCLEEIVDEAIALKYNLIVAHHPILFRGLKKITGSTYVERTIIKAIKNDIALYAIHTNLDNIVDGVNGVIARRLELKNPILLEPKEQTLLKLVTFVPKTHIDVVLADLYKAGAGNVGNYSNCSFRLTGTGSFLPNERAHPTVGERSKLEHVEEDRIEMLLPAHREVQVLNALRSSHPYEEVAYYLSKIENQNQEVGAGRVGDLKEPMEPIEFLRRLKLVMNTQCIRHTALPDHPISRVAVCGGSGSFLLSKAIAAKADVFVSADFKYHEFFDADGKIIIADIGHYESEQFTKAHLQEVLKEKFPTFAINFSETVTNPISYL